jgi:hypothetical protein
LLTTISIVKINNNTNNLHNRTGNKLLTRLKFNQTQLLKLVNLSITLINLVFRGITKLIKVFQEVVATVEVDAVVAQAGLLRKRHLLKLSI